MYVGAVDEIDLFRQRSLIGGGEGKWFHVASVVRDFVWHEIFLVVSVRCE